MSARWFLITFLLCLVALPASAGAAEITTPCEPIYDPPTSDDDTQWRIRVCDMPDFDQGRTAAAEVGQPDPISVDGLPGDGGCHCVLATLTDLYGRAQAPLSTGDDFATFDWLGRGALPPPAKDGNYDTSTYSDDEVAAYEETTDLLDGFGTIVDVSYGQDDAHMSCGTSWGAFFKKLPTVAEQFGDAIDDYGLGAHPIDGDSPLDMARALARGKSVGIAYGYYADEVHTEDGNTASKRTGGHANALVGVGRLSADQWVFETSDPVASPEKDGADTYRQSAFSRTTRAAYARKLTVGDAKPIQTYRLEDTNRYLDSWITFTPPGLLARYTERRKLVLRSYVPSRLTPVPPVEAQEEFTFPGPVLDAVDDEVASRILALIRTSRSGVRLVSADLITGRMSRVRADLPDGADRIAALPDGTTAVLGRTVLRTFGGDGGTLASRTVTGGGIDVAADPSSGGLIVLRADGQRLLRYARGLRPGSSRAFDAPREGLRTTRLSLSADGDVRSTRTGASVKQTFSTPTGGRLVLDDGAAQVISGGRAVAGRRVTGLRGATLLDLGFGGVLPEPPAGADRGDAVDQPLPRPLPGYEEFNPGPG